LCHAAPARIPRTHRAAVDVDGDTGDSMRVPYLPALVFAGALAALSPASSARAEEPAPSTPAPSTAAPSPPAPAAAAPNAAPAADAAAPAAATPAPAPAAAADAAPAAAPAAASAPTGTLTLTSTPAGVKVFLDGADTGLRTPLEGFVVAAGPHTVKLVADDGRTQSLDFTVDAGGALTTHLNLPDAPPAAEATPAPAPTPTPTPEEAAPPPPPAPEWTWMTVTGWSGLGLGTIALLAGAVVITTPTDADKNTLGFGLFGGGVGFVLGGAVLLYLDNELAEAAPPPPAEAPKENAAK
jgi:hypothetical protein